MSFVSKCARRFLIRESGQNGMISGSWPIKIPGGAAPCGVAAQIPVSISRPAQYFMWGSPNWLSVEEISP